MDQYITTLFSKVTQFKNGYNICNFWLIEEFVIIESVKIYNTRYCDKFLARNWGLI